MRSFSRESWPLQVTSTLQRRSRRRPLASAEENAGHLDVAGGPGQELRRELRWVRARRWSVRQGQPVLLDGVCGELDWVKAHPLLSQLLSAAAPFHLGRKPTFGLGEVCWSPLDGA
jgi:hypothetical protein